MKYRRSRTDFLDRRAQRRAVAVLPTLFTLGNCICGFASLHYAAHGSQDNPIASNYAIAGYLIFAAMICDVFDGFLARLTRATSEFGAELDSLADMVSFGVAPAFLALAIIGDVYKPGLPPGLDVLGPNADDLAGRLFWIIGAIYVACTALRLARFNVLAKGDHGEFRGMPSPGAAAVVAASVIFFETMHAKRHFVYYNVPESVSSIAIAGFPYVMPLLLLASALLMVSRFSYPHIVNRYLRGGRRFSYVAGIVIVALLLLTLPQITALVCVYIYALGAPAAWAYRKIMRRPDAPDARVEPSPAFPEPLAKFPAAGDQADMEHDM